MRGSFKGRRMCSAARGVLVQRKEEKPSHANQYLSLFLSRALLLDFRASPRPTPTLSIRRFLIIVNFMAHGDTKYMYQSIDQINRSHQLFSVTYTHTLNPALSQQQRGAAAAAVAVVIAVGLLVQLVAHLPELPAHQLHDLGPQRLHHPVVVVVGR